MFKSWSMEGSLRILERLIDLIRPKFYNRLTWVVVAAGLILMSSPWWSDLVGSFAVRYFAVQLPRYDSHLSWGLALVVFGLLYHLAVHYITELLQARHTFQARSVQIEHDRRIFSDFATAMPEVDLANILYDLRNQHAYYSTQGGLLDSAIRFLVAPSTQFLNAEVQAASRPLREALADLREWTSLNFFPYGQPNGSEYRYCLYPELNEDRSSQFPTPEESRRYNEFAQELYAKLGATDEKYLAFRATVKITLAV
jgi:hypothetical protein